jgi:hypothetical protein
MDSASEEPIMPYTAGGISVTTDSTGAITCTSFLNPLGNRGRMGLSMSLAVRTEFSGGRPSRLIHPPGILPTA